jgi:hypothetical protein
MISNDYKSNYTIEKRRKEPQIWGNFLSAKTWLVTRRPCKDEDAGDGFPQSGPIDRKLDGG